MQPAGIDTILTELILASRQHKNLIQFRSAVSAHQYLRLYRLVAKYVSPGSAVLDWGAGNGHFSYFLLRAGYKVSGFEFAGLPGICSTFAPGAYTYHEGDRGNPISLPFENQPFDAVLSVGVLEHVRETGGTEIASLQEIYRILKPGGLFICFHLPNKHSWIEAGLRLSGRWSHPYRYTSSEITKLVRDSGFEIAEMRRYAILPRNIWWWGIPARISTSVRMAELYDQADAILSTMLSPVCQNYLFVAQKRA